MQVKRHADPDSLIVTFDDGTVATVPISDNCWQYRDLVKPWLDAGGTIEPLPETVVGSEQWKAEQRQKLAQKRYEVETGGIVWTTHRLHTDRESQAKLSAALQVADKGWVTSLNWKFKDGFATVSAADLSSMSQAALNHIQTCFNVEADKLALIESGQDPALDTGWPTTA